MKQTGGLDFSVLVFFFLLKSWPRQFSTTWLVSGGMLRPEEGLGRSPRRPEFCTRLAAAALGKLRKFPCQVFLEIKKGSSGWIRVMLLRICAPLWVVGGPAT